MANKRRNSKHTETEHPASLAFYLEKAKKFAMQTKQILVIYPWRERAADVKQKLQNTDYKKLYKQGMAHLKKIKFKKIGIGKVLRKTGKKMSEFPKMLLIGVPTFVFFYYIIGCLVAENIDVQTEYKPRDKHIPMIEAPEAMAFLIKREVDDKMWTPNLPPIFPAYILDNMPHFQIGIVHALRDVTAVMRGFDQNTDGQKQDIKKAAELLAYPPTIWIMNKKDGLRLAPSSNAQYRKAAAELNKYARDGVFYPKSYDLEALLNRICLGLQKLAQQNENRQLEHDSDWIDTRADDLFYIAKGYTFALWQISKTLGNDFRDTILEANLYTEWTYLVNSLKKAAEYSPRFVRNASPKALTAPNHLLIQNYYLLRAATSAEKINNKLAEKRYADKI